MVPGTYSGQPLPDGWRWVRLGEVTSVVNGTTPDSENPYFWNGEIVWITPTDLGKLAEPYIHSSERKITKAGLESRNLTQVPPRSVVLSSRAPIGHLGIAAVGLCTNQGCKSFIPTSDIHEWFLYYALKRSVWKLQQLGSGATFAEISKTQLENFIIPLPPIEEQRRIAGVLREQMAAVEKAREAAQARLAAVKALPVAFLRQVFPQPGQSLPDGWRWVKLGEVCQFVGGSQPSKGNFRYEPALGYVRLVQIQDFRLSNVAVFIPEQMALRTFEISDVMIGRYGPPVFQILRGLSGAYNVALMKTVPSEILDKDFLYFLLRWPPIQRDVITQSQRSAGQSGVQKEYLEKYVIPLPPMCQQRNIAAQLNEQMVAVEKARAGAEEELNTINALPAALLRRAFNGEI